MTTPTGPALIVGEIHDHLASRPYLDGIRGADLDLAPDVDPPMWVVGPPSMTPQVTAAGGGGAFLYRLVVYVVVAEGERAFGQLLEWAQLVGRALDEPPGIRIVEYRPTTFPTGSAELPAYAIDLEVTG